jgi:alanine dehydrogenase
MDVAVDQGGCIETTRPTDYTKPTYIEHGVTHFAVTNMPGAVPRTASQALSASLISYAMQISQPNWREFEPLAQGINIEGGKVIHPALQGI